MKFTLPRSFYFLNATQFFGAMNDNLFKLLIIFSLITINGEEQSSIVSAYAGAVFVIPFLFFTPLAGIITDKVSKRTLIVWVKFFEIVIMCSGAVAFALQSEAALYIVLFLMSLQSAFFGPSKYGIVPEIVTEDQLSYANSLLVAFSFLSIILGTFLAPFLSGLTDRNYVITAYTCIGIAVAGTVTSVFIKKTPVASSSDNGSTFTDILQTLKVIVGNHYLLFSIVALMLFYIMGAFMQLNMLPYGLKDLLLTQEQSGYLFLIAALGIGCGAYFAGLLSADKIEFGLTPPSAALLGIASFLLYRPHNTLLILPIIFTAGIASGMFVIPLQAYIQYKSPAHLRGKVLAVSGFLSWLGILLASALLFLFDSILHISPGAAFAAMGAATLAGTTCICLMFPRFLVRAAGLLLRTAIYRISTEHAELIHTHEPRIIITDKRLSIREMLAFQSLSQDSISFIDTTPSSGLRARITEATSIADYTPAMLQNAIRRNKKICFMTEHSSIKQLISEYEYITIKAKVIHNAEQGIRTSISYIFTPAGYDQKETLI